MDTAGSQGSRVEDVLDRAFGFAPALHDDAGTLSRGPGAYLLVIELALPLDLGERFKNVSLSSGTYFYCGSARGPGGLRARVGRHMRREKRMRWHVDQVTAAAERVRAVPFTDFSECDLVSRLSELPGIDAPVESFGASDCRCCVSHLLRLAT